jgi:hypothetical protein
MTATTRQIALWCLIMAALLALTAICQAIGGQRYGLTLASAAGFGAGYGLHAAIVRRKAR